VDFTPNAWCAVDKTVPQNLMPIGNDERANSIDFGNEADIWHLSIEYENSKVRLSPAPQKENTEPDHRPNLPLFAPACFY
jgi:hypothetical protein